MDVDYRLAAARTRLARAVKLIELEPGQCRWLLERDDNNVQLFCGVRIGAMGLLTAPNAWAGLSKGEAHQQADRPLADYAAPT